MEGSLLTGSGNSASQNIAKTTFADYISDKLAYVSPLYGAVRHERSGNSKHQIPVQAHKFGTLISFSQEALDDTGYNLESEDLTIAVLVLCAEFYDNRTISVNERINLRINSMLEALLGRYSVNLL